MLWKGVHVRGDGREHTAKRIGVIMNPNVNHGSIWIELRDGKVRFSHPDVLEKVH